MNMYSVWKMLERWAWWWCACGRWCVDGVVCMWWWCGVPEVMVCMWVMIWWWCSVHVVIGGMHEVMVWYTYAWSDGVVCLWWVWLDSVCGMCGPVLRLWKLMCIYIYIYKEGGVCGSNKGGWIGYWDWITVNILLYFTGIINSNIE